MIELDAANAQYIEEPLEEGSEVVFIDGYKGTTRASRYEHYKNHVIHIQTIEMTNGKWRSVYSINEVQ